MSCQHEYVKLCKKKKQSIVKYYKLLTTIISISVFDLTKTIRASGIVKAKLY